jgi:hypothetical protein
MVFLLKDLFKTMNSQAVERMNKNSDKTRSSPLDFSQVIFFSRKRRRSAHHYIIKKNMGERTQHKYNTHPNTTHSHT